MDPASATAIFLVLALWNAFKPAPDPQPIPCQFTQRVIIRNGKEDIEGDLTSFHVCDQLEIVERLGGEVIENKVAPMIN